ncbi:AAA family ATPase [Aliarcobacter butzleri]|uniref:ATP-binding protein n=1 Tax=Aliarcobacter butzleri TaxID=28197 RepID=UPI00263D7050|nr:ATP-binding protein [Aliarcobacter butzleri]MDN5077266.1 AAA family ATPase [Aliarcobacter butzleri]MDN5118382.1 AAA family ATPase [Aliarcobacter butzleri]
MELVYLWVEEYKNIKNQGFNFSPRFKCEFDENTKELTINENENYVSIFPDNINVTAIVGENGSGKSSVLAGINNAFSIYKINGEYYSEGFNIKNIKAPFTVKENTIDILEHTIYLDFDLIKINPIKDFWSYSFQNIYQRNLYHFVESNLNTNSSFNIERFRKNFFNLIIKHYNKFKSSIFTYNPNKIIFSDYIQSKEKELNNIIQETQEKYLTKEKFLVFLLINISKLDKLKIPSIKNMNDLKENENFIIDNAKYLFDIKHDEKDYKEKLNLEIDAINSFFENMKQFQDKTIISINEFEKIFNQHEKAFLRLINIGFISIDLLDFKERKFFDLSYGERKFFTENLMVYDDIKRKNKNDILIVLDEPDLTLHPNWQKRYINEMVNLLSNFPEKKFHIVITSHSPFILSDIPEKNVIFLEKYKKNDEEVRNENQKAGNCKNVSKDIELKTFGANIHTLLSDGFFMSDGLMGEFAKNKINEAIDNLHEKLQSLSQKQIKSIIDTIGEPFLQIKLKQMYKEKFGLEDEIKELEKRQKEINLKIEQLKKQKAENAKP